MVGAVNVRCEFSQLHIPADHLTAGCDEPRDQRGITSRDEAAVAFLKVTRLIDVHVRIDHGS